MFDARFPYRRSYNEKATFADGVFIYLAAGALSKTGTERAPVKREARGLVGALLKSTRVVDFEWCPDPGSNRDTREGEGF